MSHALDELLVDLTVEERAVVRKGLERARRDPVLRAKAFRGWVPHPGQENVLRGVDVARGEVKIGAIAAGTGWGKTDCLAEMHSEVGQAKAGAQGLMASRSQDQADLGFKRLVASELGNPISEAMVERIAMSPHPTLYRKNGSYTTSRTTKDNCINLRGPEWDFITLDEAAFGDEYAYQFLLTRVRKSNGPVILWSSPGEEWFAELWNELEDRMKSGDKTVFAYRGPAQENPHLSPEFFERMRQELPAAIYEIEIEAKFKGSHVSTFRPEILRAIFDAGRGMPESVPPVRGHRYGLGWDLGVDSTAAVGTALDCTDPNLILGSHIERHVHTLWPHVQARVEDTARKYPGRKAIDYTGVGKAATQNLRVHVREEEQFVFSAPSRYALCVDTMKWVEDLVSRPVCSLALPSEGAWALLREQMRVHKLSMAKKKDSKSLGSREHTWDELDSFMLAAHATRMARSRGSLVEAA